MGQLALKGMCPPNPSHRDSGDPVKRRQKGCKGQRGRRTPRKQDLLHQQYRYTYELTGTGAAWVLTRSFAYLLCLVFMEFPKMSGSLFLAPPLGLFSFCLFVLFNSDVLVLFSLIVFYFTIVP